MSFDRGGRHADFEELISVALTEGLTDDEQRRLDAHLAGCADCRATQAAFADQRRVIAGMRRVAPPRDLAARVRAATERSRLPWWRRPPVIFAGVGGGLAAIAGALLAIVLLNGAPNRSPIGNVSPTPSVSIAVAPSATPNASLPPASAAPSGQPAASAPGPSSVPAPTATPIEASPEPDVYLAVTGPADNQGVTVRQGTTGETVTEVDTPSGPPIAAELSPDGQWLAYITRVGGKGTQEVRVSRVAEAPEPADPDSIVIDTPVPVGDTLVVGEGVSGSPFLEQLFWSADSRYLAFTLAPPDEEGTDVWLFLPGDGQAHRLTDVGNAYAGSWAFGGAGTSGLWVSAAGEIPQSHLVALHDDAGEITPGDPADNDFAPAQDVFQPLISPDGRSVIYWTGRMERVGSEWVFVEGGRPWLAQNEADGSRGFEFVDARQLFGDVSVGRNGFTSAAVAWGLDSNSFAVWGAEWTGISQAEAGQYPDPNRVYLGRVSDPQLVTADHALDRADLRDDASVIDVKVSPTGRHLAVTAGRPVGGVLDAPRADLLLITRNTGDVADDVAVLGDGENGWFGPAAFDAYWEIVDR